MGKIVVKKVQSQNSTTSFQLPSTDGTAGQFLKTDGSTNLGFRTLDNAFQSADKSSVTYTMPNADGTANQLLQTDSSTGTTTFASEAGGPLTNPANSTETGWRFCDKYCPLTDTPASSVTLTVPTSYTSTSSNVLALRLNFYGLCDNSAVQTYECYYDFFNQAGTATSRNTTNYPRFYSGGMRNNFGSYQSNGGFLANDGVLTPSSSGINVGVGSSGSQAVNSGDSTSVKQTLAQGQASNIGVTGTLDFWNAYSTPSWSHDFFTGVSASRTGSECARYTNISHNNSNYTNSGSNYSYPFHNSTDQHTMGFKLTIGNSSYNFIDGVVTLWAWFKNDVVN